MDERFIAFRNQGHSWGIRLRWFLLGVLFLKGGVLCFTSDSRHKTPMITKNNPGIVGQANDFDRRHFIHVKHTDKLYAENTISGYVENSPSPSSFSTHIAFPGGGIYFYYQAGVVNFLRERYDLSTCTFSGASAGALTATLTAADVDFYEATELALKLAKNAGVWDRKGGLQGIWGPMIEEWLDALLPTSIDSLQDRITLLVTPVPSFGKIKMSRFENRKDLIQCNMASIHLPWFLDGKLTSNFRGSPFIDGSFLSKEDDYGPNFERYDKSPINTIFLDWSKDPEMSSKGGMDIVEALSPDGIYGLMEQGKRHGKVMEDQGMFDNLKRL